jgi:integrase
MTRKQATPSPQGWEEALDDYLFFKQSQGLEESTLKDITQKVSQFFRTFPDAWPGSAKKAAQAWLGQQGIKPATYNLRLGNLKGFFEWAVAEGLVSENPFRGYQTRRKEPRIVDIPDEVLRRLVDLPDRRTYAGLRDRAFILLTLDNGIRPSEGRGLLPTDIDLSARTVTIRQAVSKTNRTRTLYMVAETVRALRALLRVRPLEWDDSRVPLFASETGRALSKDGWGDRMEMYSKKLGTKVRAYDLRHAFAIRYLRAGGNCFVLQRLMGHTRPETTMQYLHFVNKDLEIDHLRASPVLQLTAPSKRVRSVEGTRTRRRAG